MKINRVTITGADDNVDPNQLVILQDKFPFVEWGILFSRLRSGDDRYPSVEWIKNLPNSLKLSAHFCGSYAKEVLEENDFSEVLKLESNFSRVQLNYNFRKSKDWSLLELINFIENSVDPGNHPAFILQYNGANEKYLKGPIESYGGVNDIHFLYDSSGGRGTEIKSIQPPFRRYTGYSGGISPDNVEDICKIIAAMPNDAEVWIDMESGVRTGDKFDLGKVTKVLEIADKFISVK